MANIVTVVMELNGDPAPEGTFRLNCVSKANGSVIGGFDVVLNYADNASQKAAAIKARAEEIMAELGVTVGGGDKHTLFGGPDN